MIDFDIFPLLNRPCFCWWSRQPQTNQRFTAASASAPIWLNPTRYTHTPLTVSSTKLHWLNELSKQNAPITHCRFCFGYFDCVDPCAPSEWPQVTIVYHRLYSVSYLDFYNLRRNIRNDCVGIIHFGNSSHHKPDWNSSRLQNGGLHGNQSEWQWHNQWFLNECIPPKHW